METKKQLDRTTYRDGVDVDDVGDVLCGCDALLTLSATQLPKHMIDGQRFVSREECN
jgi:hypothetical protein